MDAVNVKYGFFDSSNGDRRYNASDFAGYFEGLISDGVYQGVDKELRVDAGTGMQVVINPGRAKILNRYLKVKDAGTLDLEPSDPQYNRWDRIYIYADLNKRECGIGVKKGIAQAGSYEAAELVNNEFRKEYALADIQVMANTTTVYDIRSKIGGNLCPYVSVITPNVDVTKIVQQYQDAIIRAENELEETQKKFDNYITTKTNEVNNWFNQLETDLNTKKYLNRYTLCIRSINKDCNEIDINYSFKFGDKNYSITYDTIDSAGEIAFLHYNGKQLTESVDWVCNDGILSLTSSTFKSGDYVDFTIVKCENTPFNYTYSKSHE